jgi:hypothetical protein
VIFLFVAVGGTVAGSAVTHHLIADLTAPLHFGPALALLLFWS